MSKKKKKIRTLGYMLKKLNKWSKKVYGDDYRERQEKIHLDIYNAVKPEEDETLHEANLRVIKERNYYKKQYELLLEETTEEIKEDDCI